MKQKLDNTLIHMGNLSCGIAGVDMDDYAGPHVPGAKLDAGKNRVGLMMAGFAEALESIAEVTTYGAQKYTDHGWKFVHDGIERYTDAMYRHLLAHAKGERYDTESGMHHMAHAAWNCIAVLQLIIDDHGDTNDHSE